MAYKFQLGAFTASGSITSSDDIDAQGDLTGSSLSLSLTASVSELDVGAGNAVISANGLGVFQGGLNAADQGIASAGAISGVTTISGSDKFQMGSMALGGTDITATAAELNYLAGADSNINSLVLPASTTISNYASSSLLNNADETAFKVAVGLEIGVDVQAYDAQLDSLSGMTSEAATALAALSNTEIALLDGATSANSQASKAVILDGAGDLTLGADLTVTGDLIILGATVSASVEQLLVQDALITIGDGDASLQTGRGFEIGNDYASFKTANSDISGNGAEDYFESSIALSASSVYGGTLLVAEAYTSDWDITSTHISGGLPISASAFVGDGSQLTGISADSVSRTVTTATADANIANPGVFIGNIASGGMTFTITHSPSSGDEIMVKAGSVVASDNTVTITDADDNIDGAASIVLESPYAAVTLIYDGTEWKVF